VGNGISIKDLEATGSKGWTSALLNFPIIEGCFYLEFIILPAKEPLPFPNVCPHTRVGIATSKMNLETSIGSQVNGYSYSDKGLLFHNSEG